MKGIAQLRTKKHSDDVRAIRKLDVEWGNTACKGDLDAVVAFYAPDGSVVWPDAPAAHGSAKVRAAWRKVFAQYKGLTLKFTAERIDVAHDADMATDFGKVSFGYDTPKGHVVNIGKYVVVWRKVAGVWKVLYDSYNMNEPET
jgi:ketosteroid isomerase-like protein